MNLPKLLTHYSIKQWKINKINENNNAKLLLPMKWIILIVK